MPTFKINGKTVEVQIKSLDSFKIGFDLEVRVEVNKKTHKAAFYARSDGFSAKNLIDQILKELSD